MAQNAWQALYVWQQCEQRSVPRGQLTASDYKHAG